MSRAQVYLLTFTSVLLSSLAIDLPAPRVTDITKDGHPALGFSPATTQAPSFQDLRRHIKRQLEPRQAMSQTCGYEDADQDYAITCGIGQACAYNNDDHYFGCCPYDSDGEFIVSECPQVNNPYTSCVPYTDAATCTGYCFNSNRVW